MGVFDRGSGRGADRGRARAERGRRESARILRDAAVKQERAARAQARTAGFDVDGAVVVLFEGVLEPRCLVVHDDRVELLVRGDVEPVVLPAEAVGSVEVVDRVGVHATLTVSGGDPPATVTVRTTAMLADLAAQALDDRRTHAGAPAPETAGDLLAALHLLHRAGVLTDAELATKTEALRRR